MNKDLTIVFSSYQSQKLLNKILTKFQNKYKIIIIENSLDYEIKKSLEKKFDNVDVVIPKENLGLAKSYNLGLNKAKTKFVFLNNPDIEIDNKSIKELLICAKKIKNLGVISPTYKYENIYKNYEIYSSKRKINSSTFDKYGIIEVDFIDNNFLINKKNISKLCFDKNYFLYYETADFTKNLKKIDKKLYVAKKIKFHHYGASSLPSKYLNLVKKTRSFHYNWSKFYFYRKNYNYLYALKKIYPNLIKSIKKIFLGIIRLDKKLLKFSFLEIFGIFTAIILCKSFYRPRK